MVQRSIKSIKFTKAVATGNDFIIVESKALGSRFIPFGEAPLRSAQGQGPEEYLPGLAKILCNRKYGIGADGLLILEPSDKADFKMWIFNSDGSEAEMCGNGSRCIAIYAKKKNIARDHMQIETRAGILNATVKGEEVKVKLTDPKNIQWNLCLTIHECPYKISVANTGVPHVIHFVDDIKNIEVEKLGAEMRYHPEFSPAGANVDFVKVVDHSANKIKVRTYERGVENETLACGTGAVASAIISAEAEKLTSPITVETSGGELLKVYFEISEGSFKNVYLEGKAKLVYEGLISV